ncbi:BLUF domain-containing protein [Luteimonas deserti]|uniref:BLUF domain-containing protein n=1 Tax=Luteimonas deserti TaxID=2752306 RepID=A0A7Z0QNG8_9GAMM|nr:BLUF domain-containing protein [Luteimonas deserti]NYZ61768.1 BLUF domain-containing protein [Luteimonas deserti]
MIRQLLYRSGQLYEFTTADMIRLLLESRSRNARRGISGMLLMRDGLFMQLLEGPAPDVDALFARISVDPRHCEVQLVTRTERDTPLLSHWRMAWAEAPVDAAGPAFSGLDTDARALEVLEAAGREPIALTMRAFLRGDRPPASLRHLQ